MRINRAARVLIIILPILIMVMIACYPVVSKQAPVTKGTPRYPMTASTHDVAKTLTNRATAAWPTIDDRTPTSSLENPNNLTIGGQIYAWITGGYYFAIRSPFRGSELETSSPNTLDPNQAILAAFAASSGQIAYLTFTSHVELWIADLNLTQIEKVWIDETDWLGDVQNRDYLQIRWGPQDNFIIVTNLLQEPRTAVYDSKLKTVEQIMGTCNQLGLPPVFHQPTLICPNLNTDLQLYLTSDRSQKVLPSEAISTTVDVHNWAFSPDGQEVVYATKENNLLLSNSEGQQIDLTIAYIPPVCCGVELVRDDLQWSPDGSRLLVYGSGPKGKYLGWHVLNANNGETVWTNTPEQIVDILQKNLSIAFNATLSPDGLWVATSYCNLDNASSNMVIISLATGQVIPISEGTVDLLKWVNNTGQQK